MEPTGLEMQVQDQSGNETQGCGLMFPGQGTQYIGMGAGVCDQSPATARVWDCASDISGFDVRRLCMKGPMPKLDKTQYQQVAVTAVNVATLTAMRAQRDIGAVCVAGHSVGEFSALYAAGILGLEDVFRGVTARGTIMNALAEETDGAMYAIKGIDRESLVALMDSHAMTDRIDIANDNSPRQQVVSGTRSVFREWLPMLLHAGFEQVRLPVNGAWHSGLMRKGVDEFQAVIDRLHFADPLLPVFTNQSATALIATEQIKRDLVSNLYSTVRWRETMHAVADSGVRLMLEVGPKKVLSRLLLDFQNPQDQMTARHAADFLTDVKITAVRTEVQ